MERHFSTIARLTNTNLTFSPTTRSSFRSPFRIFFGAAPNKTSPPRRNNMPQTALTINGESFLINGKLTYTEMEHSRPKVHGLLMNARFIQGIFDDKADPKRFARWGKIAFDPDANTENLIAALPEWYQHGLRAFTVGFQGGGPCFTISNDTIHNNPFGEDGKKLDAAYADRMDKLIKGADVCGMAVIVSYFYGSQARRLKDENAVRNAVTTASNFLKDGGYTNVLIEVANEQNIGPFREHPLIYHPEGMATLIELARKGSGGMVVGCSGSGGHINREIGEASDYILIHGNSCSRQRLYNVISEVKSWNLNRPIVCNEDSQAIGQLEVAFKTGTSWGYYNNMTKQEPPADWSITKGEDTFFAKRLAIGIGIPTPPLPEQEHYYLQGLEPQMEYEGKRWVRLASQYPETINYVDFYCNGNLIFTAYDEPFTVNYQSNWRQGHYTVSPDAKEWKAVAYLRNGEILEKTVKV
jgi:hypothetical protein